MTVFRAGLALLLFIHISACLWILLAMNNADSWLFTSPELTNHIHLGYYLHERNDAFGGLDHEERLDEQFNQGWGELFPLIGTVYATCIYFMTTTMTCVGYGDIRGWTDMERLFLIGIAFASCFIVAVIRNAVFTLL